MTAGPPLEITKALDPMIVPENGQQTYTFTICNYGNTPQEATDNVVLTDVFDPVLEHTTITFAGAAWSEGVAPGTKWEEVLQNFECPLCYVDKNQFSKE